MAMIGDTHSNPRGKAFGRSRGVQEEIITYGFLSISTPALREKIREVSLDFSSIESMTFSERSRSNPQPCRVLR